MNTKKLYFIISIIFILHVVFATNALSQFGNTTSGPAKQVKTEKAKMILGRTLLVLHTDVPELDKKIQEIVNEYWELNENIQFISGDKLKGIIAGKETEYCILSANEVYISQTEGKFTYNNEYMRITLKLGEEYKKRKALFYHNIAYETDRTTKEKDRKEKHIFDMDKKEILFAIDFIQNHINARIEGKNRLTFAYEAIENSGKLSSKTLLIASDQMDKKLTEQDVQENYPYKFKIVDAKDIESAYLSRNKDFAFVAIAPMGYSRGIMTNYIVDCETGQILSFGEQHNGAFDNFSNLVSKDHIKAYSKNSNRKKKK